MPLRNQVQLIAYPDRMGSNLGDLYSLIERHFASAIGGIQILPPYPSNADSGFSPLAHKEIYPRYGTWDDIERISSRYDLCLDLTLDHISDESVEFRDFYSYSMDEVTDTVKQPVVKRLLKLMEFRSSYAAFNGIFHLMYSNDSSVAMCWRHGEVCCELFVDLNFKRATIRSVDDKSKRWLEMRC